MTDTGKRETDKKGKTTDNAPDHGRTEKEIGGPKGPEPTRYGDWEVGGIASDF